MRWRPVGRRGIDHVVGETIQARVQCIANRAGVRVRGETPTSKMGRRFWYTTYLGSQTQLLENLDEIVEDQGSSNANVVLKNYLLEGERWECRINHIRERLAKAFGGSNGVRARRSVGSLLPRRCNHSLCPGISARTSRQVALIALI